MIRETLTATPGQRPKLAPKKNEPTNRSRPRLGGRTRRDATTIKAASSTPISAPDSSSGGKLAETTKEREGLDRNGHRREYDPRRTKRQTFQHRTDQAIADVGMYRNVAYRDVVDTHFDGHPYAARRAVDQMISSGHVREHTAEGPQGGNYKVLTLTERGVERAERVARHQGLDSQQKAWSGLVKPRELQHDVAVFRAAKIEQMKLLEQGATIKRVRIDAELKREIARATESSRARGGKEAADAARSRRQRFPRGVPGCAA